MPKQQTLIITLPEPCHENWDKMKPIGCGRFCGQCEKTVIDFTEMTDAEIVKIMTKAVSIPCGKFKDTQLNRAMIIPDEKQTKAFPHILSKVAASLLLCQTIASNSFGQRQERVPTEQISTQDTSAAKLLVAPKLIRGHIIDGASQMNPHEGFIGAGIKVVGTDIVAQTDLDGNFEIDLPEGGKDMLEISFPDYETQTVKAIDGMELTLRKSGDTLTDVIVATPYGPPITKTVYTGAADIVSVKKIENAPVTDITKYLEGNIAGVTNTYGLGQSNSRPPFHIGAVGSVSSSNKLLIILNGVVYNGDISSIDQKNILEIKVLKDAAATSLYGARGANGVILVTTKNAKRTSNFWDLFRKKKNNYK